MSTRLCVIVGFVYSEEDTLISSSIDMFTVYDYFSARGFSTVVLSDITTHSSDIVESIFANKVSDNIYSFLPSAPLGRDPLDDLEWSIVTDSQGLILSLNKIDCSNVTKLVVYYTGHSERCARIVTPDSSTLFFYSICDNLLSRCSSNVESLVVTDSCYIGCDYLPFKLSATRDRFYLSNLDNCKTHSIIHLSSSGSEEVSLSGYTKSLFTKSLFKHLSHNVIKLTQLMTLVQNDIDWKLLFGRAKQTVLCGSSFDRQPVLYSWLLKSGLDIETY